MPPGISADTNWISRCWSKGKRCTGISKANSGIIYQGYDQHPGSLKASLCVRASRGFQSLCEELDVAYRKCGLLMPSFGPKGDQVLAQKKKQGEANNVEGLRILSSREVYEMEPFLRSGIRYALYAENTFTVNPWSWGIAAI
jgi:glycerol-3-phosphate dehydrogenase